MARDMTQAQFKAALAKHGMTMVGWGGYVTVRRTYREDGSQKSALNVCRLNAGTNLRAQLAYLLRAKDRDEAEDDEAARIGGAK